MKNLLVVIIVVMTTFTLGGTASATTINSTTVAGDQLTIDGVGFAGTVTVTLDSQKLSIVSNTATQIVATMNPIPAPGSYRLVVKAGTASTFAYVAIPAASSGVYDSSSNVVPLTTTPTSIIQPAPQLTQAGSYMFIGNVSLYGGGWFPIVTCFVQVGSTGLLPSVTQGPGVQYFNLTTTGAITLTSADVPATVSLLCGLNAGGNTTNVTAGSLSIIQVGTLQTGS